MRGTAILRHRRRIGSGGAIVGEPTCVLPASYLRNGHSPVRAHLARTVARDGARRIARPDAAFQDGFSPRFSLKDGDKNVFPCIGSSRGQESHFLLDQIITCVTFYEETPEELEF